MRELLGVDAAPEAELPASPETEMVWMRQRAAARGMHLKQVL